MITRDKIHIAAIQETHVPHGQDYTYNGYRIITSAAQKENTINNHLKPGMHIGGVAILVQEELSQHIVAINRIDNRIKHITLQSPNSHTPITIINSYAPHKGRKQNSTTRTLDTSGRRRNKKYHKYIWKYGVHMQMAK